MVMNRGGGVGEADTTGVGAADSAGVFRLDVPFRALFVDINSRRFCCTLITSRRC
jgi:hypothetical protein